MQQQLSFDLVNIDSILDSIKEEASSFLKNIDLRKCSNNHIYNLSPLTLNVDGIGAVNTLKLFKNRFDDSIVASTGPRYWGFVTGGATPAALMGDMLASLYDQNTQSVNGNGDISARIEIETIELLLDLLELPKEFIGGFVTGATMSNFTCLAVARQWIGKLYDKNFALNGIDSKISIMSGSAHSSILKSLSMLGIGSKSIITINSIENNREAIDTKDLEHKIAALNNEPFILIANAGTVNSGDFDNFEYISKLKEKYNFWFHIDAAFGAFAKCSSKHKHLLNGWENADSITIDCHKWLNVPYENAFFLINKQHNHLQLETFQNSNAPYLGDPLFNFNYLNFLPENSRRLKALTCWFSLVAYGKNGYQYIVENSIKMANVFGNYIESNKKLKLLAPIHLNNVCFGINKDNLEMDCTDFLNRINENGRVFMTPTLYKGEKGIRASFVNWRTKEEDINIAIEEIENALIN